MDDLNETRNRLLINLKEFNYHEYIDVISNIYGSVKEEVEDIRLRLFKTNKINTIEDNLYDYDPYIIEQLEQVKKETNKAHKLIKEAVNNTNDRKKINDYETVLLDIHQFTLRLDKLIKESITIINKEN